MLRLLSLQFLWAALLVAQAPPAEPFKLGTFLIDGSPAVGIVLRDSLIVHLNKANADLELDAAYPKLPMPANMIELIERYEYGTKLRLYEIVSDLVSRNRLAQNRPSYVYDLVQVKTMPPLMYPGKIMNAAVNFYSHVNENGTPEQIAASQRQRRENRGVPYLFLKPTRGAIIGDGDTVVLPYGRTSIDWEVEIGTVIGRTAKYVNATNAKDFIFGYTVTMDISDRGGRPPGGAPFTTDWFVGKGHDTFAPMGPWIVPKEFYGDPMEKLHQTLSVGGVTMQDARAGDMIHSLYELIEYASSLMTLYPGDVLNNGTSGGTGMGTAVRGQQQFLKPGDPIEGTVEGIGTLRLKVAAEKEPGPGTGSRLPPVSSYRR
jgi:2-keto-4-pentenoate hydratase/2-oxohepta-3-ene-1,7-dioic acid hydratase in catechol pathway